MKTRIIAISFGLIMSFILGELITRGLEYYQYKKNSYQFDQYKNIYSDERDKDYLFGHKANIDVKLEKGYYKFTFITNSEGLRETNNYKNIKKSIIYLGDSIIEGASVENDEVLDEVFEYHTGITSLNFGLGSSNTVQQFYFLKAKYKESYNTKLIILGFCLNDFQQNTFLRYFDTSLGNWQLYKFISNKENKEVKDEKNILLQRVKDVIKTSKLVMFVYSSTRSILKNGGDTSSVFPPYIFNQVTEEEKYYTEQYINKIHEFSEDIMSEFVVIIFPQESQLKHNYTSHKRMQDALIQILKRNDIKYLDLYDFMKMNYNTYPDIRWFYDDTHPYKEGHRLIGEYLAEVLPKMFPRIFE